MSTKAGIQSTPPTLVTICVKLAEVWDHDQEGIINTPQGPRTIKKGDYLLTDMAGERYVCQAHRYMPDMDVVSARTCVMLDVSEPKTRELPTSKFGSRL